MRLRKRIISAILSTCMAVTLVPANMPLKAMAAEEATVPEINEEKGVRNVKADDSGVSVSRKYISTEEENIEFTLTIPKEKYDESGEIKSNKAYLYDTEGNLVAESNEYAVAYYNHYSTKYEINFDSVRCLRKLKDGEKLSVGYSNNENAIKYIYTNVTIDAISAPYIYSCILNPAIKSAYYGNDNKNGLYSGDDNKSIVQVTGYNIDFSKLSLTLTGDDSNVHIAGYNNCIEISKNSAYYIIDEIIQSEQNSPYKVKYQYNKDIITEEEAVRCIYDSNNNNNSGLSNSNVLWNPKNNTLEYYNINIPVNGEVCVSGSSITATTSSSITAHLVKFNLGSESQNFEKGKECEFTYKINGIEKKDNTTTSFRVIEYKTFNKSDDLYAETSIYPAKLIITDWYSLKPLKEIEINGLGQTFKKSELKNLSSENIYNFFMKGADGSVGWKVGYINIADDNTPAPAPSIVPSSKPPVNIYIPGPSIQPTAAPTIEPTVEPTIEPTVEPTVAPTVVPTTAPTAAPTIQPTAAPTVQPTVEPTAQPTATPEQSDVPEEKGKLKLKKNKITLTKGQKTTIKITSELNTSVTYKSLKPSVAAVNKKGVVTAKKAGTAVITVKANGQVKKVKITVKDTKSTVKNSSSIKLDKNFKLSKKSVTLKKGKKFTIQKESGLSGKVTFRSLDKKIASVSVNGVVKARKKGKTTILIKRGKKTIKLKVTVKK